MCVLKRAFAEHGVREAGVVHVCTGQVRLTDREVREIPADHLAEEMSHEVEVVARGIPVRERVAGTKRIDGCLQRFFHGVRAEFVHHAKADGRQYQTPLCVSHVGSRRCHRQRVGIQESHQARRDFAGRLFDDSVGNVLGDDVLQKERTRTVLHERSQTEGVHDLEKLTRRHGRNQSYADLIRSYRLPYDRQPAHHVTLKRRQAFELPIEYVAHVVEQRKSGREEV